MKHRIACGVLCSVLLPTLAWAQQALTLKTSDFLIVPDAVKQEAQVPGASPFTVAKEPPTVELAMYPGLEMDKALHPWWSAWGDICVAGDGRVYTGIGDHGDGAAGTSKAYIYRWDPKTKQLSRLIDINRLVERRNGEPTFSKVHARIDEGSDGRIYFTATLNNGAEAADPKYKWSGALPGGQLYAYDPKTDRTQVVANLPARRCAIASRLDRRRNIWWCNLDGTNADALWAYDLTNKREVFRGPDGSVAMNRNFALGRDGTVYFNGRDSTLWKHDPTTNAISPTSLRFPPSQAMRCSTDSNAAGDIFGISAPAGNANKEFNLFRFNPETDALQLLGKAFTSGYYTTVCVMSPDQKFVYYIPGAPGTPLVQYEIAEDQRKVIAFLAEPIERRSAHVLSLPFGLKMSADGSRIYANFNGSSKHRRGTTSEADGLTVDFNEVSFVAVHIPASEH